MKFDNLETLVKYIINEEIDLSEIDVDFNLPVKESVEEPKEQKPNDVKVKLKMLSDSPDITAKLSESNVLFVEDFSSLPNQCTSGKIEFMGRQFLTNMCCVVNENGDEIVKATLPVEIQEGKVYNVDFLVKKKVDEDYDILLSESMINDEQ